MTTAEERARAHRVREMFGAIASRYDFLNHLLSANIDRRWRRACVRAVSSRLAGPDPRILDLGCGTADLSIAFSPLGSVIGCDFSHPMLLRASTKVSARRLSARIRLAEADALELPFAESTFDAVVSAFVLRNLANTDAGLREMKRVLRPGGVIAILDFGMPKHWVLSAMYRIYFGRVLPRIGTWVSGVDGPYRYLPQSVGTFPPPEELKNNIVRAGFESVDCELLSFGIAVLLLARVAF